jgi:hypothetical protein
VHQTWRLDVFEVVEPFNKLIMCQPGHFPADLGVRGSISFGILKKGILLRRENMVEVMAASRKNINCQPEMIIAKSITRGMSP